MRDIHSHILYGIDDGAKTKEQSLDILRKAAACGVTDIVLTPHFIKDSKYQANNRLKKSRMSDLVKSLKEENIDIKLYLGNEVYIDEGLVPHLKSDIMPINNSKYLLVEFPLNFKLVMLEEKLNEIMKSGLIPIIAHPERYVCYYKDFKFFEDLIDKGCLLQGNVGSLFCKYGKKSASMLKELLKRDMIFVLGFDVHRVNDYISKDMVEKRLLKIIKSEDKVRNLLENNFMKIINNQVEL